MESIDQYQLQGEIARGGMGVVYRARDASGREVALKVLLDHDPESAERFRREVELAQQLDHPNVVRVHGHGVAKGRPYLVMDYVDGEDLMARLKRDGPLPETEARRLFLLLGEALNGAHALGIVHRDLKPQNVLLRGAEVYLTDFGLARRGPSTLTATGELLGTPAYMAPEQAIGERDATGAASDVYGFGATLYTALCGEPPHRGPNLYGTLDLVLNAEPPPLRGRRAQDLSPELEELVSACLRKEPGERPLLPKVLEGLAGQRSLGQGRSGRAALVALACAVGLAGLGTAWALNQGAGAPSPSLGPAPSHPSLTSTSAPTSSPDHETAARLARAALEALLVRYDYDRARESFEAALAEDPECGAAYAVKANWAFALNRFDEAMASAERVGPETQADYLAWAHYARGRALVRQREELPPEAGGAAYLARCKDAFRASLKTQPSARAWAWLGRVQFMEGDDRGAARSLAEGRKVSRLSPHLVVLSHDLDPGREVLDEYIGEGKKQSPETKLSFELGLLLVAYSVSEARSLEIGGRTGVLLAQIRRIRPREGSVIERMLADSYMIRVHRAPRAPNVRQVLEKAGAHLRIALEDVAPGSLRQSILLAGYGSVQSRLGNYDSAVESLDRALAIKPSQHARELLLLSLLAQADACRADWNASLMDNRLQRVREVAGPETPRVQRLRQGILEAWLKTLESDFSAAERRFAEVIELGKAPDKGVRQELARAHQLSAAYLARGRSRLLAESLGRPSESAVADFRRAVKADPRYSLAKAWLAHGLSHGSARDQEQALAAARAARRSAPVGHPARALADLVLASKAEGWRALATYLKLEPGNPRFLGIAMTHDPIRAQALIEAATHARDHPLMILANSRAGRLSNRAAPEWFRQAEASLTRELDAHPDFNWLLAERGLVRQALGKLDLAQSDLERAQRSLEAPSLKAILDTLRKDQ